jgi:hypothetical protein
LALARIAASVVAAVTVVALTVDPMTRVVGVGLLASAFAPLVALLAVLRFNELGWVSWLILAACLTAIVLLVLVLRSLAVIQARSVESTSVRRADERVLAFTSSYLLPVVVALFGGSGAPTIVATSALVAILALIYVRAGLYHLNPTLAVLGFRLYEVTVVNGAVTMLLTRSRHIAQHGLVECRYLGEDVAIQLGGRP